VARAIAMSLEQPPPPQESRNTGTDCSQQPSPRRPAAHEAEVSDPTERKVGKLALKAGTDYFLDMAERIHGRGEESPGRESRHGRDGDSAGETIHGRSEDSSSSEDEDDDGTEFESVPLPLRSLKAGTDYLQRAAPAAEVLAFV
jgi:hypothetical protein